MHEGEEEIRTGGILLMTLGDGLKSIGYFLLGNGKIQAWLALVVTDVLVCSHASVYPFIEGRFNLKPVGSRFL